MCDNGISISFKGRAKEFFISKSTSQEIFNTLIVKAFRLKDKIQGVYNSRNKLIQIKNLRQYAQSSGQHIFQLKVQLEEVDKCSNKQQFGKNNSKRNLSKSSGRKAPPQENEIAKQKFFIEDFQLFMAEVHKKKSKKIFGIIFFQDHKNCKFLGKKILRQLIFEYGSIQFYYSIYPSKKGSRTKLLGPTLAFSIFHGQHLILERDFPQNLSAIQEIGGLLKHIINSGELKKLIKTEKNKKNLVKVPSYKSMKTSSLKQTNQPHPEIMTYSNNVKNQKQELLISLKRMEEEQKIQQNLIKNNSFANKEGQIKNAKPLNMNEISFEHSEVEYPDWFSNGDTFDSLQKGVIVHFINTKNEGFHKLCAGFDIHKEQKKQLNTQLIRLLCRDKIEFEFKGFSEYQREYIEMNKNNRMNMVFNIILKFQKFGNFEQLIGCLKSEFEIVFKKPEVTYAHIAHNIASENGQFKLKLFQELNDESEQKNEREQKLLSKIPHLNQHLKIIADSFHYSCNKYDLSLEETNRYQKIFKKFNLGEQEISQILKLLANGDPFIRRELEKQQLSKDFVVNIRRLLVSKKYEYELLEELESPSLKKTRQKIEKFTNFKSLVSYLFEYKRISKKQEKLFFYLYIWQDMNVLGAFETYLANRDLDEFIDTMYIIDQIYYNKRKYGMEMSQIQRFNDLLEHQLSILFTHKDQISLQNRLALEKLLRAGDTTIIKYYRQFKGNKKVDFIKKLNQYAETKRIELQDLQNTRKLRETKQKVLKQQRLKFLTQIIPVHFKKLANPEVVYECLQKDQHILDSIFEVYEVTQNLVDWIENFRLYIEYLPKIHCNLIIQQTLSGNSEQERQLLRRLVKNENSLIIGIYQVYSITKDQQELQDSLKRIIIKYSK